LRDLQTNLFNTTGVYNDVEAAFTLANNALIAAIPEYKNALCSMSVLTPIDTSGVDICVDLLANLCC